MKIIYLVKLFSKITKYATVNFMWTFLTKNSLLLYEFQNDNNDLENIFIVVVWIKI